MSTRNLRFIGGFGNQLFQYCHAKAACLQSGNTLHVEPWLGQQVFDLTDPPITDPLAPSDFTGYAQRQEDLIYTRTQAIAWLPWNSRVRDYLDHFAGSPDVTTCHLRRGDYLTTAQVVVSTASYLRALLETGLFAYSVHTVSEENPTLVPGLPHFLPDFLRLASSIHLLRADSTYSWWAHVFAHPSQAIYSPVIDGLPNGERDCIFVSGNHPKMSNSPACTDLYLAP